MNSTVKKITIGILITAFVLTIGYAFYFNIKPSVDAKAYDSIAMNLVSGNGYVENAAIPAVSDSAIGRVGPGYQFFLFIIYWLFGHSIQLVWILQAMLHIGSAILIFFIAKKLFGEQGEIIGCIASTLFVLFIDLIEMTAMIMTETLTVFLIILSMYLFIRYFDQPTNKNVLFLGITIALSILTRPTALFFFLVVLIFALLKKYYVQALIITACAFFIVGPWTARNYITYGRFIPTTAAGGYDLWVGNNPAANGELNATPEITNYLADNGIVKTDEKGIKEVKYFIFHNPIQFVKLLLVKTSIYFSFGRPLAFWFYLSGLPKILTIIFSSLFAFIFFSFGLSGAWMLFKERKPLIRWLLLLMLAAPLSVVPIIVETRYRFPVYPFLALFAGYFIVTAWQYWHKRKEDGKIGWQFSIKAYTIVSIIIIANTAFDFLKNLDVVKNKLGL